ncbi:MAG: hypothetical protein LBK42_13960 [Propionibacteriaceae bacterium]|nr:hypothetical protein [Propionibacteriaceae bacterium]
MSLTATGRDYRLVAVGFQPGESITVTLHSESIELGSQTADATGRIDFGWTIPADFEPGSHRLVLSGVVSGQVEQVFTVAANGALVQTGPSSAVVPLLGLAGVCLALGLVAFRQSTIRRRP